MSAVKLEMSQYNSIFSPQGLNYAYESTGLVEQEYRVTLSSYREVADETPGKGLPDSTETVEVFRMEDKSYAVVYRSEDAKAGEGLDPEVYLELGEELEQNLNEGNINEKEFLEAAKELRNVEKIPGVSGAEESIFEYYGEMLE